MKLITFNQFRPDKGIPYCRVHLSRMVAAGQFPKPISFSNKRIAWVESEVDDWVSSLVQRRDHKLKTAA